MRYSQPARKLLFGVQATWVQALAPLSAFSYHWGPPLGAITCPPFPPNAFLPSLPVCSLPCCPIVHFPASYRAHRNLMTPSGVSFLIGLCPLISWDSTPICIKCFHALKLNPHQRTEQTLLSRLPQEEIMQRSCIIYQHRAYSNPGLTDTKIYSTILLLTICTESSAVPPITCLPPPDGPCTTIPSANKIYLVHPRKLHVNG